MTELKVRRTFVLSKQRQNYNTETFLKQKARNKQNTKILFLF